MKNVVRTAILIICVAVIIVGYYFYLSRRGGTMREETAEGVESELSKVLAKDFSKEYPETPRSVVKWYNRIIMLYYDEETSDQDVERLCDQAMMLFDADLLQANPKEFYLANVRADITDYHSRGREIRQTSVQNSGDVEYKTIKDRDYAYVIAYYFTKEGSNYTRTYQKFALRKDDAGKWKILAMELTDEDGNAMMQGTGL